MKEKYFIAYSNVVNITIKSKAILNALRYVTTMFFCLFTCIFLTDQTFICQNTIFVFSCLHLPMYASCFQKNPCSKWLHIFVGDLILSYVIHCNLRVMHITVYQNKAYLHFISFSETTFHEILSTTFIRIMTSHLLR